MTKKKTKFAENTTVPYRRSMAELEKLMERFGADQFITGTSKDPPIHFVEFRLAGRVYRLDIKMPALDDYAWGPLGSRSAAQTLRLQQKEINRRWRVLVHVTKGILVGVDDGLWNFEEAMQPFQLLPDGRTVRTALAEHIASFVASGSLPLLLPGPGGSL